MRLAVALSLAIVLAACGPAEPVRIGFLGGLSGRVADLGIGGRNGAQLAVDLRNGAGGIRGRQVELIAEDDRQDPAVAAQSMARLVERKVAAVIGPMTSAMALAVVKQADDARLVLVSPTATTNQLAGKDDYFFRVISTVRHYARVSAEHHGAKRGLRSMTAILDTRNRAYTEDWLNDYRDVFADNGGRVVKTIPFASGDDVRFADLARQLVDVRSDGILILANSVDTAMLLQQIRKIDADVTIATAEWAATERLIELAGKAAEGVLVAQFLDRQGQQPAYVAFRRAYIERFGMEPGFAGLTGFDAANAVMGALARQSPDQSLKAALLTGPAFAGAQVPIAFDAYGDVDRPTFMSTVRNGQFVASD